jgi:hypothetical protein
MRVTSHRHLHALARSIVQDLVFADFAEGEIAGAGVGEVEAGH